MKQLWGNSGTVDKAASFYRVMRAQHEPRRTIEVVSAIVRAYGSPIFAAMLSRITAEEYLEFTNRQRLDELQQKAARSKRAADAKRNKEVPRSKVEQQQKGKGNNAKYEYEQRTHAL